MITTRTSAVGDADLALDAERLGAGAGVGDDERRHHGDDDRRDRQLVAALGERRGDARSARCPPRCGRASSPGTRRTACPCPTCASSRRRACRMIEPTMNDDAADEELVLPDEHGGDDVEREARHRDRVRRQARRDQPVAQTARGARRRSPRAADARRARVRARSVGGGRLRAGRHQGAGAWRLGGALRPAPAPARTPTRAAARGPSPGRRARRCRRRRRRARRRR